MSRQLRTFSSRRKLLYNFIKEQAENDKKDTVQSGLKSSSAEVEPKVYKLREPSNIKYFEDENDTDDFSPDCSEYNPSPDRKPPNSRCTSSLGTDLQDMDNISSSNPHTSTRLAENESRSNSSLGGDTLLIDNLLHTENIPQSPSTISNLSVILSEANFIASPTVIYKMNHLDSPKKQEITPSKLVDISLKPANKFKIEIVIEPESPETGTDITIENSNSLSSIHNEVKGKQTRQEEQNETHNNNLEKDLTVHREIETDQQNDIICVEENRNEDLPNCINKTVDENDQARLDVEGIFLEHSEENLIGLDNNGTVTLDPLALTDQVSSNPVNEKATPIVGIPVERHADNDIDEVANNDQCNHVDSENNNVPPPKKLTRKRKGNPSEWKDNKNKKLKNSGQAYEGARNKKHYPEKKVLSNCTCKKGCGLKFSTEDRQALHTRFYELANRQLQWQYITRHVKSSDVKKITLNRKNNRTQTLKYHLPLNNEDVPVCKVFFLNTLSITEQMIYTAFEKIKRDESLNDNRGKHQNRPHQMKLGTEDSIKAHINLFPKVESHYTRKESKREYLSEFLNISKMYRLYKSWFANQNYTDIEMASKRQYERVFNTNYNFSFFKPKKDQCTLCSQYQQADPTEKANLEENYRKHLQMKERVREMKKEEKDILNKEDTVVAIFDLEKVLNVPQSEVSIFHYKRKYPIYNFTVFDALNKLGFCYVWQAQIGKKGSIEIGSCLLQFIKTEHEKGIKKIIFYSDGCYGQNKNRYIFALHLYAAINFKIDIIHRFFISGHSQNEGDSMHACIERELKNKVLYTPDQIYSIIMNAKVSGEKYILKEMQQSEILNIKELVEPKRWLQDKTGEKVRWSDVMEVCVSHTKPNSFLFKYDYDQEYIELDYEASGARRGRRGAKQVPKKIENTELKPAYDKPIPITKALYDDLMSLCNSQAIPHHYQSFYNNLNYCDKKSGEDEDSD